MPVRYNGLLYACGEALRSLGRNKWMTIASVGVVVVTLLMLGGFMMVNLNLEYITENVKEQVEIVLYLDDESTLAERNELREKLLAHGSLEEVRFVSKSEALQRLKADGRCCRWLRRQEDNPLRDSFELKTKHPELVGAVAEELAGYPAVADVDYGKQLSKLCCVGRSDSRINLDAWFGCHRGFLIAHHQVTVFIRRREIMIEICRRDELVYPLALSPGGPDDRASGGGLAAGGALLYLPGFFGVGRGEQPHVFNPAAYSYNHG